MYAYMHVTMHTIPAHTTIYRIKALVHVLHMYDIQEPVHIPVFIPQGENSHDTQQKGHSYFSHDVVISAQITHGMNTSASPSLILAPNNTIGGQTLLLSAIVFVFFLLNALRNYTTHLSSVEEMS